MTNGILEGEGEIMTLFETIVRKIEKADECEVLISYKKKKNPTPEPTNTAPEPTNIPPLL